MLESVFDRLWTTALALSLRLKYIARYSIERINAIAKALNIRHFGSVPYFVYVLAS